MKDKNYGRFVIDDKSAMESPNDNIICKECIFRDKKTSDGFKNSRCQKYVESIKPLSILFENGTCKFYKKG